MCSDSLTKEQAALIADCKSMGFGYRKFAESVETQGWCSKSQEAVLRRFKNKRDVAPHRRRAHENALGDIDELWEDGHIDYVALDGY